MLKNRLIILASIALISACNQNDRDIEQLSEEETESTDTLDPYQNYDWNNSQDDDSAQVQISIDNQKIALDILLFGDSWIVSPLADNYPYGKMEIRLEENVNCKLGERITQIPQELRTDLDLDEPYTIIKEKATITQELIINDVNDFEVEGSVIYVLEPICDIFKIEFTIKSIDSEISLIQKEVIANATF
jgi:hypothetical protein